MIKRHKLIRLDNRHSHRHLFTHMVQFYRAHPSTYLDYQNALMFCYDAWGPSIDVETYGRIHHNAQGTGYDFVFSPEWAYLDKYEDHRIYFTDTAASWFRLSHPGVV